jgi:diacylglycerol O-acyltransferase
MPESQPNNSFSWGDALFLYLERPGQPLSIASVSVFEGAIPLKACRDFVESKLPLVPRYRQHIAFPPFNIGLPSWQFDPNFDIRNHIRQVGLRHGTERELKAVASKILSTNLDRTRPLWDLTLVRGLEGNRTGMIVRIHHCLADGMAGLAIVNVLMDPSPVTQPLARKQPPLPAPPVRDQGAQLLDGLLKSYVSAVKGALRLQSEAFHIAQELANQSGQVGDLMKVMPELAAPADRLPFNVVCRGPQKFGWTEIPMAEIQSIRQHCGGTVNDVILSLMTATIRRYAQLRGVRVKGRSARIMIPVNVRGNGNAKEELGNRISFLPVTIPLDIRDPLKLFAFVRERMEVLKRCHAAELVGFAGGLFSTIPSAIWAAIGPVASQLPLSLCNTIVTNIPGPPVPLYFVGHKMLSWYPYVPIGGEMGLNCAILSYNGVVYFGFTCDVNAVPDPENLEKFLTKSCAELHNASKRVKAEPQPKNPEPATEAEEKRPKRRRPDAKIPVARKAARAGRRKTPAGVAALAVRAAPRAKATPEPQMKDVPSAAAVGD